MKPTRNARLPAKSILDPAFRYRPSHATDVRETFERVRRERRLVPASAATVLRLPRKEHQ